MVKKKKRPQIILHGIGIIWAACCVIPFLIVIAASFSKPIDIYDYGYRLFPKNVDFSAYASIFKTPMVILRAYGVTAFSTIMVTFGSMIVISAAAYTLARKNCPFRKVMSFYFFFTLLFSGGLVPSYILKTQYLHMRNTIWVMIIPSLFSTYYMIMMRSFMQKLPESLFESAKLDGANEILVYLRIALPLSKPSLATVGFFTATAKWNDWQTGLYFIDDPKLYQLQYLLHTIQANIQTLLRQLQLGENVNISLQEMPGENLLMAMAVVATGPMLVIFPLFQKYFVAGLTVGAVKG